MIDSSTLPTAPLGRPLRNLLHVAQSYQYTKNDDNLINIQKKTNLKSNNLLGVILLSVILSLCLHIYWCSHRRLSVVGKAQIVSSSLIRMSANRQK